MTNEWFIIDFNPIIFSIGPIDIRWYSLFYIIGFLFLYLTLTYAIKKKILDFKNDEKEDYLLYSIIGVIIGGRIGYFLFYEPITLITNPLELFKVWHGGMSFHGGLIGIIIATLIFSYYKRKDTIKILDTITIVGIFSLMLGRIGNFINGELAGTLFNGKWCIIFPLYDNLCRHPYPIYAFLSHLLLFIYLFLLLYINKNNLKSFIGKGIIMSHFLIGYGILRIITDIWKLDNYFLIIKQGQLLSILMIISGIILIFFKKNKISKNKKFK
jgi:phosphatidylglycerol---prolipoprotein diacylglyceryl transferase